MRRAACMSKTYPGGALLNKHGRNYKEIDFQLAHTDGWITHIESELDLARSGVVSF